MPHSFPVCLPLATSMQPHVCPMAVPHVPLATNMPPCLQAFSIAVLATIMLPMTAPQVLYLEQLLTTGGGWQDQCGGLYGGAKMSQSHKGLPVHILTQQLETPSGFMHTLNQHLMLVYTGKTRLARNLLQVGAVRWVGRSKVT